MIDRVNPFGDLDDFAPTPAVQKPKPEKAVIDQVAADNGFPSRQPKAAPQSRPQRRYVTGRNQQINVKATSETIDEFYRIADDLNLPLGEVLKRALEALRKATK